MTIPFKVASNPTDFKVMSNSILILFQFLVLINWGKRGCKFPLKKKKESLLKSLYGYRGYFSVFPI